MGRHKALFTTLAFVSTLAASSSDLARAAISYATPTGVYAGTIGNEHVTVELGTKRDSPIQAAVSESATCLHPITGTYFYDRVGIGIYLGGCIEGDGRIELREVKDADDAARRSAGMKRWWLTPQAEGFLGDWTQKKTAYAISLTRIAPFDRAKRGDADARAYRLRLRAPHLKSGVETTVKTGLSYRTVTDDRYDLSTIQFVKFANTHVRDVANRRLLSDLDEHVSDAYDCLTNLSYQLGDFGPRYGLKSKVAFVSAKAVSIDMRGEISCGYAYPSYTVRPITIDLRDGERVNWHVAMLASLRLAAAYRARAKYDLTACKAPGLQSVFGNLANDDFEYELRPSGLDVYPDLPHVIAGCARDVLFPTPVARRLLARAYRELLP